MWKWNLLFPESTPTCGNGTMMTQDILILPVDENATSVLLYCEVYHYGWWDPDIYWFDSRGASVNGTLHSVGGFTVSVLNITFENETDLLGEYFTCHVNFSAPPSNLYGFNSSWFYHDPNPPTYTHDCQVHLGHICKSVAHHSYYYV